MQRIAVTVTASGFALRECDRLPEWTRPAWLTEAGFLFYRDTSSGIPSDSGFRMIPPPAMERQEWRRCSANHETLLVPQGGRGYLIQREPGAEWEADA
jgi:hypothetical protein